MTSGSNCRHLNKPQTEDARRSILPAYHRMTAKLQHFRDNRPLVLLVLAKLIAIRFGERF
jgi:hypothetical protein